MTRITLVMAAAVLTLVAISSCEEDTLNIGQTLTDQGDKLEVATAEYDVSTRTIMADSVLAVAADCYLGSIKDPETDASVNSAFTTQFHLLENTYLTPEDSVVNRYDGRAVADSCDIILYLGTPFRQADSLTAMKMLVTELATPMSEGRRYYSNFSPSQAGMLRQGGISQPHMFTYANLSENNALRYSSTYAPCIRIALNDPYTAPDGTSYKNYGSYIMRQYYDHHELFRNSYVFTHQVCPGFLFQITDGLGFHAEVINIGLRMFYTKNQADTAHVAARLVLAGTREVLQTTHISNDRDKLLSMAAEEQHTYLKTPAGLFTEVTLPVTDIKRGHEGDSLLAAKVSFQRLNNQTTDDRALPAPQAVLLVQKDSLHNFFEQGRITDNVTSFYTTLNSPVAGTTTYSENNNTYAFYNLSTLITHLWNLRQKGLQTDAEWEAHHPDWNKMVLVPVNVSSSTSAGTVSSISHDMSLSSTRLVGGANNPNDPIRINVVYGRF